MILRHETNELRVWSLVLIHKYRSRSQDGHLQLRFLAYLFCLVRLLMGLDLLGTLSMQ